MFKCMQFKVSDSDVQLSFSAEEAAPDPFAWERALGSESGSS